MVHYTQTLGTKPVGWEYPVDNGYAYLSLPGDIQVNSVQIAHAAGRAGIGLIQAGLSSLAHHIKRGALVEVLCDLRPEPLAACVVVAHKRNLSRRVRIFIQWLETLLKLYLDE